MDQDAHNASGHSFVEAIHHPFIEAVKHVTSPLSASLLSFVATRYAMRYPIRTWAYASRVLRSVPRSEAQLGEIIPAADSFRRGSPVVPVLTAATAGVVTWAYTAHGRATIDRLTGRHFAASVVNDKLRLMYSPTVAQHVREHLITLPTVKAAGGMLHWIREHSNLSWCATIAVGTVCLRLFALPFSLGMLRNVLRMNVISRDLYHVEERILHTSASKADKLAAAKEALSIMKSHRAHPLRDVMLPLVFPPVFLSFFSSIHNLCLSEPTMRSGGILWFQDLTIPDPSFFLPVLSGLSWLVNIELGAGAAYVESGVFRLVVRTIAVSFIPICSTMPAGVFCFWITSNVIGIVRLMALRSDVVRKLLRFPLHSQLPGPSLRCW